MAKGRTQEGSALVVATLLVIACIGLVFAIELASPAGNARADRASERALAEAREALIAYAADRPINAIVGPGYPAVGPQARRLNRHGVHGSAPGYDCPSTGCTRSTASEHS